MGMEPKTNQNYFTTVEIGRRMLYVPWNVRTKQSITESRNHEITDHFDNGIKNDVISCFVTPVSGDIRDR